VLLLLDSVAARYHTDPATLLGWDSFRLGLAVACVQQSQATDLQNAERVKAFPVFNVRS